MKKLTLIFLLTISVSLANAAGINFLVNPEWATILKKAKEEHKLIFLDAFAIWCGPCKAMDTDVYADPAVAEYYNANFINVKYDMEAGEGIDLARKFKVTAYPSLFFVNDEENIVHKDLGYKNPGQFIALGKAAIDPSLRANNDAYNVLKGKATTLSPAAFLEFSAAAEAAEDQEYDEIVRVFLSKQPDVLASKELIEILMTRATYLPDEKVLAYVIANKDKIRATGLYTDEEIKQRLSVFAIGYAIFANTNEADGAIDMESVKVLLDKYLGDDAFFAFNSFKISYYLQNQDQELAFSAFKAIIEAPVAQVSFDRVCYVFVTYAASMEKAQQDKLFTLLDAYKLPEAKEPNSFYKDLVKAAVYGKQNDMDKFKIYAEKVTQNSDTPEKIKATFRDMLEKLK